MGFVEHVRCRTLGDSQLESAILHDVVGLSLADAGSHQYGNSPKREQCVVGDQELGPVAQCKSNLITWLDQGRQSRRELRGSLEKVRTGQLDPVIEDHHRLGASDAQPRNNQTQERLSRDLGEGSRHAGGPVGDFSNHSHSRPEIH